MSASDEWTEWHLTPTGWQRGTEKEDFRRTDREPPEDRVLTVRWSEHLGHHFGAMHRAHEETWRSPDAERVATLLTEFGEALANL